MDIGLALFPTDYTMAPGRVAQLAEERGFRALLFPEHTHIPVSRETPYPGGGELPREYSHTHDLFVAMSMAAALTERLEVGSGVCLVPQRDPIITANAVASIDALSGGRVLFGVGGGWNREEMQNHGTDPGRRFKRMRESIEAMKAIWTQDEAEYHGEFVDFDPIWCWPKPAREAASAGARRRHGRAGAGPGPRLRRRVDAEPGDGSRRARRAHPGAT